MAFVTKSGSGGFTNLIQPCEIDGTGLLAGGRVVQRVHASSYAGSATAMRK
jgi:hypothetical protein